MKTTSLALTAAGRSVEKVSRSAAMFFPRISLSPGSKMGVSPARSWAIFFSSTSTETTLCPESAKQVPATNPTYPVPMTAILMDGLPTRR